MRLRWRNSKCRSPTDNCVRTPLEAVGATALQSLFVAPCRSYKSATS